jgi:repressor of nif and glnA expression
MVKELDKKVKTILKIISEAKEPIGSVEISEKLKDFGIDMPERTVRYHLKLMNDQGLLKVQWKEGRLITSKGIEELSSAFINEKVGFMSSRIDTLAFQMDFDLYEKKGRVILNLSFFRQNDFKKVLGIMKEIFIKKLGTSDLVMIAEQGQEIGHISVPTGKIAFGTICSINLNGILLRHAIPIESIFGGILQYENSKPANFTEIINYAGSTLDPHEVFIRSRMTSVREAAAGDGRILAGLREIPAVSRHEAEAILRRAESVGLGRALMIGKAGQALLGVPVGMDRVGLVVPGGLNPVAAAVEWGLEVESKALVTLVDFSQLINFKDL